MIEDFAAIDASTDGREGKMLNRKRIICVNERRLTKEAAKAGQEEKRKQKEEGGRRKEECGSGRQKGK